MEITKQPGLQTCGHYNKAVWASRNSVVSRFVRLRELYASAAEAFLLRYFKAASHSNISLVDEDTGRALSPEEMIRELVGDYKGRAANTFPQDPGVAATLARQVGAIRQTGGAVHAMAALGLHPGLSVMCSLGVLYSEEETEQVINALKPGKLTIHGCNAAVAANVKEGRRLTRALMNLGRHVLRYRDARREVLRMLPRRKLRSKDWTL